jgi:hypothetical protein
VPVHRFKSFPEWKKSGIKAARKEPNPEKVE